MPLTQEQIDELDAIAGAVQSGGGTPEDQANYNYAVENFGYSYTPPTTEPPPTTDTPPIYGEEDVVVEEDVDSDDDATSQFDGSYPDFQSEINDTYAEMELAQAQTTTFQNDLTTFYDTQIDDYKTLIVNSLATVKGNFETAMDSLLASYNVRKELIQQENSAMLAGVTLLGIRSGRQRYAGNIHAAILSGQEDWGMKRLTALDAEELEAKTKLQDAYDSKEWEILNQEAIMLQDIEQQKIKAFNDLQVAAQNENDRLMSLVENYQQGLTALREHAETKLEGLLDAGIPEYTLTDAEKLSLEQGLGLVAGTFTKFYNAKLEERKQEQEAEDREYIVDWAEKAAQAGATEAQIRTILEATTTDEALIAASPFLYDGPSFAEQLNASKEGMVYINGELYPADGLTDPLTGAPTNPDKWITVQGPDGDITYDFTSYAGDITWADDPDGGVRKILRNILLSMPNFVSTEAANDYIQYGAQGKWAGSPITGEMIEQVAMQYGIDGRVLMAVIQKESDFGTSPVAVKNNNPGGYTWFDEMEEYDLGWEKGTARPGTETGNYVNFPTMLNGLKAIASNISRRRIDPSKLSGGVGELSALAQSVVDNPGLLSTFTPTIKGDIIEELAIKGYDIPIELSMEEKIRLERDMKKDFNTIAKDTKKAVQQIDIMNTSFDTLTEDPSNEDKLNAASQGILVVFQKMLDPTSVVRESEYARSGTGLSLEGRIQGFMKKLEAGGAGLTVDDLKQFVDMGNTYFTNVYRPSLVDEALLTRDIANKYNLDLQLILTRSVMSLLEEYGEEEAEEEGGISQTTEFMSIPPENMTEDDILFAEFDAFNSNQ